MMKTLVTGAAGFIGMHLCRRLLERGDAVVGIDNLNDYYAPQLKHDRLALLREAARFRFEALDIADGAALTALVGRGRFDSVVHLAAQAGVRYSIDHPQAYGASNLSGFLNVIEACRHGAIGHLVYASSSSVYGANVKQPFSEDDRVDSPVNLYAATKRANELMAYAYSHLFRLPATGLRFFTVYGPWGRPDMAYYAFARAIVDGRTIDLYNRGEMARDFTYIDDVVSGIVGVLERPPADAGTTPPQRVFNIGNHRPEPLRELVACLEHSLGRSANLRLLPMQPGEVTTTYADVERLAQCTGFAPTTTLAEGIARFVAWFRDYHGIGLP